MKKLPSGLLLFIILVFFAGCIHMQGFLGKTQDNTKDITPGKTSESEEDSLPAFYQEKALEYEKNDELQMALLHMKIAGALDPNNEEFTDKIVLLESTINDRANQHFKKGVEFYEKRKFKDARKQFLIALRYDPDKIEALSFLKNRLIQKEYTDYKVKKNDTLKGISKKIYKDPEKDFLIAYFNNLKIDKELEPGSTLKIPTLEPALNRPSFDISKELPKADELLQEKRYEEALNVVEKILKYDRSNKEASDLKNAVYFNMGTQLSKQKKYPEAIAMFKKIDSGYDGVKEAIREIIDKELNRAKKFLKEKQYEKVITVAKQIMDYDKSNKAAKNLVNITYCQKGKHFIKNKKYKQALEVLNKADPKDDCVGKAIGNVNKVMKQKAEVHYLKGVKHFLNEELNDAIKEWEETIALDPEHKKAENNIKKARNLLQKLKKVK